MLVAGKKSSITLSALLLTLTIVCFPGFKVFADATLFQLVSESKYQEAIDHINANIPNAQRTSAVWVQIALAHEGLGMIDRALATYMVAWRMQPDNYDALFSIARIYNGMGQPANALPMAEAALKVNFTADASWEFAKACIELGRPADAKKALEQVIQADPQNATANRELGGIYYSEGDYARALPPMMRAVRGTPDGETAFRIGRAYIETAKPDSAMRFLRRAVDDGVMVSQASLLMARAFAGQRRNADAIKAYEGVAQDDMTAMDFYACGMAMEAVGDASGALESYRSAVSRFGDNTRREALLARAYIARAHLRDGTAASALPHLEFILAADERGAAVRDINFLLADTYIAVNRNAEAIGSLERAIALDNKNVEAYARLAELYEKAGDDAKAKRTYEQLVSMSPDDPAIFLALGNYNLKAERWSEAATMFERSIALKPSVNAHTGAASAAFRMGNGRRALEAARAAIGLDTGCVEARVIMSRVLIDDKNYRDALRHMEFLNRREPNNLEYLKLLAECYEGVNNREKLLELDRRIVAVDRQDTVSRLRLAALADSSGDFDAAFRIYTEVAGINAKNSRAHWRLAEISAARGRYPEAESHIGRYLEIVPDNAAAHRNLGDYLYNRKDYDGALVAYREALKYDPNIRGFHTRYAEIVIAKGQTDEVITALTGVMQSGDADVGTYTTLGMIYQGRQQYREAVEMYSKALLLEPANYEALAALGLSQAESGDVNSAVITFEQVVMMNTAANREFRQLGDLYTQRGRNAEALEMYMQYLAKNTATPDRPLAERVGRQLFEQQKYKDAARFLSLARSNEPAARLMFAEANIHIENYRDAIDALEPLRPAPLVGRAASRTTPAQNTHNARVLSLLAQAYEKDGQSTKAAQAYAAYITVPGVKDQDAAYNAAYLQEQSNRAAAVSIYESNIKAFPNDVRNHLRLGLLFSQRRETAQRALPLLQRSASAAKANPELWLELAKAYKEMGRVDDELNAYRQFVGSQPQHVEANKRIGAILIDKDDFNGALINLEIANTIAPNDPELLFMLARCYMSSGRNQEAVVVLERAKRAKPDDVEIRFGLYELYTAVGQHPKALEEITELAGMNKESRFLRAHASALIAAGRARDAEATVNALIAANPVDLDALMMRALVMRSRGNNTGALDVYEEIVLTSPGNAAAHFEMAETLVALRQPPRAELSYNRALRINPEHALAHLGLAKLHKSRNQMEQYTKHLLEAQRLLPNDPRVLEELQAMGAGR